MDRTDIGGALYSVLRLGLHRRARHFHKNPWYLGAATYTQLDH